MGKKEETTQHERSSIINYFQGATINNLVINGNMTKNGTENFYAAQPESKEEEGQKEVDIKMVVQALERCKGFLWGQAALATIFCVCRDTYHLTNASQFERQMEQMDISCPQGTIANAMRNSPYMKLPISKWEHNGAQERVLVLMKQFMKSMEEVKAEAVPT